MVARIPADQRAKAVDMLRRGDAATAVAAYTRISLAMVYKIKEGVQPLEARAGDAREAGAVEADLPPPPAPALHDSYIASLMARGLPLHEARWQAALRRDRERNGGRRVHSRQHEAFSP